MNETQENLRIHIQPFRNAQVSGDDLPDAVSIMKKNGIPVSVVQLTPESIRHSQKQIDRGKVKNIIKDMRSGKKMPPCIISNDRWMVDGHHRNVAHKIEEPGETTKYVQIGLPRDEAIEIYKKVENQIQ